MKGSFKNSQMITNSDRHLKKVEKTKGQDLNIILV